MMDYFLKNNPYLQISPNLIYTSNEKQSNEIQCIIYKIT